MNINYIENDNILNLDWNILTEKEDTIISSSSDGLIKCLNDLGYVDIDYIHKQTGIDKDKIITDLKGAIYLDPAQYNGDLYSGYKTSSEYLSGNLLNKYKLAKKKNKEYGGLFSNNIKALESLMPRYINYGEIFYSLSSPWIPDNIKKDFIHSLGKQYTIFKYENGIWDVYTWHCQFIPYYFPITEGQLLQKILNCRSIAIHQTDTVNGKKKTTLNIEATLIAQEAERKIQKRFKDFIESNEERKEIITDLYNRLFGYSIQRKYDGSFLTLPNMNPNVTLFDYQKNAIARIIFNRNTLLAHNVGAGKTYEMICAGEELLRLGLSKKNLYVIPNNITSQWQKDYKYLYPNSSVLFITPKDFVPSKYRETLELIKSDLYDAIIMPYSSFDKIPLSKKSIVERCQKEYDEVKEGPGYEQRLRKAKDKLIEAQMLEETVIGFDELGITRIFIDEAHNYKNVPLATSKINLRGINATGSTKCAHLMDICEYVNSLNNGGIIMATGTPITNSISDIYVFQKYLQNGELNILDIKTFDSWLAMFVEEKEEIELDVDATNYRVVTRLNKFHNLPELANIIANVIDFHFDDNDDELPKFNGYKNITLGKSNELNKYINNITKRIELIRSGIVDSKEDNMLKVTTDGRLAALDLRLVNDYKASDYAYSKIYKCASVVSQIYYENLRNKSTQLVFSDIGTPKDGFNVYDELKNSLTIFGIPKEEIAFIHDADTDTKRDKLFKEMKEGKIRILIGSTFKLGLGINVQDKLIAIHHLDIPWRPADIMQREGRIIRRGNENKEVFIYRYITVGSFDAYSWQILENKQKFISELLANSLNERTKEDVSDLILNYGEVKALAIGDPKLKEYADLSNQLAKYKMLSRKQTELFSRYKCTLLEVPSKEKYLKEQITYIERDMLTYFINKKEYSDEEKKNLREYLYKELINNIYSDEEKHLYNYQGFELIAPINHDINDLSIIIKGEGRYNIKINTDKGTLIKIDNFLEKLSDLLLDKHKEKDTLKQTALQMQQEMDNAVDYTNDIMNLTKKLEKLSKELGI